MRRHPERRGQVPALAGSRPGRAGAATRHDDPRWPAAISGHGATGYAARDDRRPPARATSRPPSGRLGKVHHVALIVRSIEDALGFWRDALGLELETVMDIPYDRVRIAFLGGRRVEDRARRADRRHDRRRPLPREQGRGLPPRLLRGRRTSPRRCSASRSTASSSSTRAPRRGAEGPVAFLHPRSCHGVLVELIEAPGGPAWASLGY